MRTVWLLAAILCFTTTMTSAVAFQHSTDRSLAALVLWGVIGIALVAPFFLLKGLANTGPQSERTVYMRSLRFVLLTYLPLQSALMLLAFYGR